ncbi:MAG: hypothetical protein ACYC0T_19345 [Ramlibacter sp.]
MKILLNVYGAVHALIAALFAAAALVLIAIAARIGWDALTANVDATAAQQIIEAVGLLAAAVVALQISQTVAEEEVLRGTYISGPTRVRRFLSRFLVVVVVALVIEGLVATFKAVHEDLVHLLYAAALLLSTGAVLAAWGVFVKYNRAAEELEPEAMREVKEEDREVKQEEDEAKGRRRA